MAERSLIFPASEYRDRIARLQALMPDAGVDALLLTTPADIFYTTGFLTRFWESPARPWFVIIPAQADPVAVIPSIGMDLMQQTWITNIRSWGAPDPRDDGVTLLSDTLCDLVPEAGAVGVPMGLETQVRMPLASVDVVQARIAPRRFQDATAVVQRVREIKSDAEIAKIKTVCGIADRAFASVADFASEGVPLDQVFRAFQIALLNEGADWVSYVAGSAGQGGYGDVISPATTKPLMSGDVLMLDTGAVKDGYFCDFDRNFAVGHVCEAAALVHDALWQTTETVLNKLRPGQKASDVRAMICTELTDLGVTPASGRLGHGLGVTLTEWPSFTPHDHTELRAGMVLTLEPGAITSEGKLIVHEENIVLRPGGAELLSQRAPRALPRI